MSADHVADFLAMGGHGLYVWLCYSVSLLVVLGNVITARRQIRRTLRELVDQQRRQTGQGAR